MELFIELDTILGAIAFLAPAGQTLQENMWLCHVFLLVV